MEALNNYINGSWVKSKETNTSDIINPATQEVLAKVPHGNSTATDVAQAVEAASEAYKFWSQVPVMKRVQPLYKLKQLLEENAEDIARTITTECGKTLAESRGELQRAIENVETACGAPMLIQSEFSENIAGGVDEFMIRQPLGVCACISPFNFPGMIPFWFLPYAIACGNTFILKPSEKVPLTMMKVFKLIEQIDLPARMIAYCYGQKYAEMVCTIIPSKKGLKLGFYKGVDLPDPGKLLEGTGKISRYVEIRSAGQIRSPALKKLIESALAAYEKRMA